MKHIRFSRFERFPIFVINRPCSDQTKEHRKEKFRDYIETNRRECGPFGQQRNRHFVWWLLAQDDRRAGRLAQAEETLKRSKEKRLEVEPLSPMAALEERLEIRRAHELLRRLRAGRR